MADATGPDYGAIKSALAQSKWQRDNPSGFQSIVSLIDGLRRFQQLVESNFANTVFQQQLQAVINAIPIVSVVEIDASGGPTSVAVSSYVNYGQFVVFKDVTGSASGNTITITGLIDGAVDPTITTDYGTLSVYRSGITGGWYTWSNP